MASGPPYGYYSGASFSALYAASDSYLLILWQPMLAVIVPGAANLIFSQFVDPILDQHIL